MAMFDLIVVGAGLSGIIASRFYLDIHPGCRLLILEEDSCIGGVWSHSRIYPGFWSQSGRRMAGFSDKLIDIPPDAETYHDTFKAEYVTKYLEDYVDEHFYRQRTLRDRIIFGFKVHNLVKEDGIWIVSGHHKKLNRSESLSSSRIIVASGSTSTPAMPHLPNEDRFQGPILHQKYFGKASATMLTSPSCQNVTVLGGGKSASDMVYDSVKAGKKNVSWIIRGSGSGPVALSGLHVNSSLYKNMPELAATRLCATMSPSGFFPWSWWLKTLHGSRLGRHLITKLWLGADQQCRALRNFKREKARPGFDRLEPETTIFWCTGPLALIQHEDFWDTIAQAVSVYRSDIRTIQDKSLLLEDGSEIASDVLFCGTGWNQNWEFLSKYQIIAFGLPHDPEDDSKETKKWNILCEIADREVLSRFPQLANPPPHFQSATKTRKTPTRLYNCIAPLNNDSIAFMGCIHVSNSFRAAEAQAIWITAYFDGNIKLPPVKDAEEEVAYMTAFCKRRYPSQGALGNYFHMDLVPYTDKLMKDIGLSSHRRGWRKDLVYPCLASDFAGIKDEYLAKFGNMKSESSESEGYMASMKEVDE